MTVVCRSFGSPTGGQFAAYSRLPACGHEHDDGPGWADRVGSWTGFHPLARTVGKIGKTPARGRMGSGGGRVARASMSGVNDIRSAFLNYFAKNGHEIVPSSPLVPRNDPTLMFTNA